MEDFTQDARSIAATPLSATEDNSFVSPEARYSGHLAAVPKKPPHPWNTKYVKPIYVDDLAPHELAPDEPDEWMNSGARLEAGRRRYSAYNVYDNRDGPQLQYGIHPSRSSLRPLQSSSVRTVAADHMECRSFHAQDEKIGTSADSLECRTNGYQLVMQKDGSILEARGILPPGGSPFSGYCAVVPKSCCAAMEADPKWQQPRQLKKKLQVKLGGKNHADETLMDSIIAEFKDSDSSSDSD